MKLAVVTIACAFAAAVFPSSTHGADSDVKWTYKSEDRSLAGPSSWGDAYPTCAGKRQSPIDISVATDTASAMPLKLAGECDAYNVTQHYDSFKAEVQGGSCAVHYFGKQFHFAQVHFHAPSEHTVGGEPYDAEVHFVHMATDGKAVVLGVFLQRDDDGEEDEEDGEDNINSTDSPTSFFANFFETLNSVEEDAPVSTTLGSFHASVESLFSNGRVFSYAGGLTVPPCSEVVSWWVLETPLAISQPEYDVLTESLERIKAASDDGTNARPTQPLHGREVIGY